jgi:hypothetical protein
MKLVRMVRVSKAATMNHLIMSRRQAQERRSRPAPCSSIQARAITSVVGPAEQLTKAISTLIGLPKDAAASITSQITAAEARLVIELGRRTGAGRPGSLAPPGRCVDLEPLLAFEERVTPYVLALPFTIEAVTLLDELSRRTRRILHIERTPLAEPILRAIAERNPDRVELHSPGELIRRNLSPRAPGARGTVFVTFPDHHWTGQETSRRVPFFNEDHWFPLVESLLLVRGVSPILTLAPRDKEGGRGLVWAEYHRTTTERPVTEEGVREPLVWLASCLEATMRACPAAVLSWNLVTARSARAQTLANLLDQSLAVGFIRAWHASDPIAPRQLLAEFLEGLERAQPNAMALPPELHR